MNSGRYGSTAVGVASGLPSEKRMDHNHSDVFFGALLGHRSKSDRRVGGYARSPPTSRQRKDTINAFQVSHERKRQLKQYYDQIRTRRLAF